MSEPFIAEIRIFSFNFAPRNWAQCNGQLLPIAQNTALFSLVGTYYGGNGTTNFALPDLRGRVALHAGTAGGSYYTQGQAAGVENCTLLSSQMPLHTHAVNTGGDGTQRSPENAFLATESQGVTQLYAATANTSMAQQALSTQGGSQAHTNMMPSLTVNVCIALYGIYPSRN